MIIKIRMLTDVSDPPVTSETMIKRQLEDLMTHHRDGAVRCAAGHALGLSTSSDRNVLASERRRALIVCVRAINAQSAKLKPCGAKP